MLRPSHWAALFVVAAASAALAGCGHARGCLAGCGSGDAGEAGHPQGPGTLDSCPARRACPHVTTVTAVSIQTLGQSGTAHLGNAIETTLGPAVSWILVPDQPGAPRRIGVALPGQNQVVTLDSSSSTTAPAVAPMLLSRQDEIDLVPAPFDKVIPIPLDTLQPGTPLPITLDSLPGSVPTAAGIGQALAILVDPGPKLLFFDSGLGDPLFDVKLGSGSAVHPLALTQSCNGLLASWGSHVEAFTPLGDRAAPAVDTGLAHPRHVVWDGAELVVSGDSGVVELDSKGKLLSRTALPMGVAVGTDNGLLTIADNHGSSEAVVRKRTSGSIVKSFGATSQEMVPEAVVVAGRYIYFVQASTSSVLWLSVVCSA